MSAPANCNPCCSTTLTTQIPGAAGADATPVAPDSVDPNGVKVGTPGQTYLNAATGSFWVCVTAGNAGWRALIGVASCLLLMIYSAAAQPVLPTYWTTNTTAVVQSAIDSRALVQIAADVTKQPASASLTNYVNSMKWTGIRTNGVGSGVITNYECVTNGIVVTNKFNP